MRVVSFVFCIFLSIFFIILLSVGVQGTEYNEIDAKTILAHIEKGEDVNYIDYYIKGELNTSKIKLETESQLDTGYPESKNLHVIKGNITFKNSYFEDPFIIIGVCFNNNVDFSGTTFNSSTDFSDSTFKRDSNFNKATFNSSAYFYKTTFKRDSNFNKAIFKRDSNFNKATFERDSNFKKATFNSVYFCDTTFNSSTNFNKATFNSVYFFDSTFNSGANFSDSTFKSFTFFYNATFKRDSNFNKATFKRDSNFNKATFNSVYFFDTTFNSSANFGVPETSENIITDGKNCELFMKSYTDESRYTDANNIYYNYRKNNQDKKALTNPSKLIDIFSLATCGYGARISHTLIFSVGIIFFFACLYSQGTIVSLYSIEKNKKPVEVYRTEPKIYRLSDETEKKSIISFFDAIYFSLMIFTTLGSEWNPRDNYRKWVAFEGVLGYIMLGIFLSTLGNILIKP